MLVATHIMPATAATVSVVALCSHMIGGFCISDAAAAAAACEAASRSTADHQLAAPVDVV
jgi:hypothetical protein